MARQWLIVALVVAPAVLSAQGPLNPSGLAGTRDSFVVLVQGQVRGFEVTTVERTSSGIFVTDVTDLMPVMRQHTQVQLSSGGAVVSVKQEGTVQAQPILIDVVYAGGRATGRARTLGRDGKMREIAVDEQVPPGVVDDNALLALLPAIEWAPGLKVTLPVFASGINKLHTATFQVVGTEEVTVPAGTFKAFRVTATGLPTPMTVYVSAAAPHRLLKAVPEGAPVEILAAR